MPTFTDRLAIELSDLGDKIEKLTNFIGDEVFNSLIL